MSSCVLLIAAVLLGNTPPTDAYLPNSLDLGKIRALTVQHDGRWPPLDTMARDLVESVTDDEFFQGHDPVLVFLAWTFNAQHWMTQPVIEISNAELRSELQLSASKSYFSFRELMSHAPLRQMIINLSRREGTSKLDPLESKVSDINMKLGTLDEVFRGQMVNARPNAADPVAAWRPLQIHAGHTHDNSDAADEAWLALSHAFNADDSAAFSRSTDSLVAALDALPAAYRPDFSRIATELRYNKIRPFRTAWIAMAVGAVLSGCSMLVRRRWFDAVAIIGMLAGFGLLTYGLSMRWQIAGRIPASNMYESLLFLSWGMGAFAIVAMVFVRHRIVPLTASAMGAIALLLADCLPIDHFVRPIAPVLLDTVWMSIHVPIIMVSYSVLTLGVLVAHGQLFVMATAPKRQKLAGFIDTMHYWYILTGSMLLLAGIITGSMWAASSWGRYWGWDPKEVWSLVAFLGYMAILHVRIGHERIPSWAYVIGAVMVVALSAAVVPKMAPLTPLKLLAFAAATVAMVYFVAARGLFATATKSIVAFWMIIMTYVGVNYVLGIGLHSYGFGTGAVARNMFIIGGIDLALVAVFGLIYWFRRPGQTTAPIGISRGVPA